jgi:hypothetical protein
LAATTPPRIDTDMDVQKQVLLSRLRHEELLQEAHDRRYLRDVVRVSAAARLIAWLYNQFAKPELERAGELRPATI